MKLIKDLERIELKPKPTNWNFKDLEGRRFGKLYVAGYLGKRFLNDPSFWLLHCDCGNFVRATSQHITSGKWTNCGCVKKLSKKTSKSNVS
jgi:hypothetical protein